MIKPDFDKVFGINGNVLPLTDTQFLQGLAYLGDNPPTKEEFNWIFQQFCLKMQWLNQNAGFGRWQPDHAYAIGEVCFSSVISDYKYMECTVGGTSGTAEPTWPAVGSTVVDGTNVTWSVRDMRVADSADDNSTKKVTTSWLRTNIQSLVSGCIAAVATAAGFACSLSANGYIKLPSWLGGLILQWGTTAVVPAGTYTTITFPITFPVTCLCGLATPKNDNNGQTDIVSHHLGNVTRTTANIVADAYQGGTSYASWWLAIGC